MSYGSFGGGWSLADRQVSVRDAVGSFNLERTLFESLFVE